MPSGVAIGALNSASGKAFQAALDEVMLDLAHQVVRDGEGATKFVEIAVTGAASDTDARRAALAIANSPLVKTAIAGRGRELGPRRHGGRQVRRTGRPRQAVDPVRRHPGGREWLAGRKATARTTTSAYMKGQELKISVDLGIGNGTATVWTCDLTHGYIDINADYRS